MAKAISKMEIAHPYAKALFEDAVEDKVLETVASEIISFKQLVSEVPELSRLMNDDLICQKDKLGAILAVADKIGVSRLTRSFLGVLAENCRLDVFSEIVCLFQHLYEDHMGILSVAVDTAQELDDKTARHLTDTLAKIFEKQIHLNVSVKPDLIGGLTVRVGCHMIDASIKSKLQKLNLVMKGVGI